MPLPPRRAGTRTGPRCPTTADRRASPPRPGRTLRRPRRSSLRSPRRTVAGVRCRTAAMPHPRRRDCRRRARRRSPLLGPVARLGPAAPSAGSVGIGTSSDGGGAADGGASVTVAAPAVADGSPGSLAAKSTRATSAATVSQRMAKARQPYRRTRRRSRPGARLTGARPPRGSSVCRRTLNGAVGGPLRTPGERELRAAPAGRGGTGGRPPWTRRTSASRPSAGPRPTDGPPPVRAARGLPSAVVGALRRVRLEDDRAAPVPRPREGSPPTARPSHRRHRRRPAPECASHHSGGVLAHPSHGNRCVRLTAGAVVEILIGRRHLHRHPSPAPEPAPPARGRTSGPGASARSGRPTPSATSDRQRTGTVPSSVMCPCSSRLLIAPLSVMLGQSGAAPSSGQPYTSKSFHNSGAVTRGEHRGHVVARRSGTGRPSGSTVAPRYSWPPVSTTGSWFQLIVWSVVATVYVLAVAGSLLVMLGQAIHRDVQRRRAIQPRPPRRPSLTPAAPTGAPRPKRSAPAVPQQRPRPSAIAAQSAPVSAPARATPATPAPSASPIAAPRVHSGTGDDVLDVVKPTGITTTMVMVSWQPVRWLLRNGGFGRSARPPRQHDAALPPPTADGRGRGQAPGSGSGLLTGPWSITLSDPRSAPPLVAGTTHGTGDTVTMLHSGTTGRPVSRQRRERLLRSRGALQGRHRSAGEPQTRTAGSCRCRERRLW